MPISDKLNDLISDIGRLSGQPVSYSESGQTIESKVNYISKLLDNFNGDPSKLDAPTTPGTAGQVLTSDGEGGQVWAGIAAGEVIIDDTLSVQGAAAEAKAVGDLKTAVEELEAGSLSALGASNGQVPVADGAGAWAWGSVSGGDNPYYVTPQQFGAKGDGVTDDTTAIDDCITYAMAHGMAVYLPAATYIKDASIYDVADGQSLIIYGDGQNSCIKRKPNSLTEDWKRLFRIRIAPVSKPANDVILSNFCIDSNRRNQSQATSGYTHEACADVTLMNGTGASDSNYLDRFIVYNMRFYDPVADCVNISGSGQVYVKRVYIQNMVASGRQGTRNDIGITGNPIGPVFITNCHCGSIHFEYNQTPSDDQIINYLIDGCVFDVASLGAKINLKVSNCYIKRAFLISGFVAADISDCNIIIKHTSYTIYSSTGNCKFENCRFYMYDNPDNSNALYPLYIQVGYNIVIHNCEFLYDGDLVQDIDGDSELDHAKGWAIEIANGNKAKLLIDGCRFDEKIESPVRYSDNNIVMRNMVIDTLYTSLGQGLTANESGYLEFENIKLSSKCKNFLHGGSIAGSIDFCGLIFTNESNFKFKPVDYSYAKTWITKNIGNFHRSTKVSTPLDYTLMKSVAGLGTGNRAFLLFKGDEFIYAGSNPQCYPKKWVLRDTAETVYNSSNVATTGDPLEDRIISIGSGYGTTAQRPSCYLSPGWQYFDTDLAKTIAWNGTTWVNVDGTALS